MKKNFFKFCLVFLLAIGIFGCSDEFLEPERNTSTLTNEDLAGGSTEINPDAVIEGSVNGLYAYMIQTYAALGGANRHYDFGHKSMDVWTDMLSGDMALSTNTYGWYSRTSNLIFTQDFSSDENAIPWNYLYRIISISNSIIESFGGENAVLNTDSEKATFGQAKALRAYGYFYLTQLYQKEYNPTQPILPFYTSDISQRSFAKVPASQIYNLMIDDLEDSVILLENFNRTKKNQVNKWVAKGLLAYVYAAKGDNEQARIVANDIVDNGGFSLTTTAQLAFPGTGSGFNNVNTPSWMWGYDLNADLGVGLVSWWGQIDYFSYSYAAAGDRKAMDNSLYSQMPTNDVRRNQFLNNPTSVWHLMPINKFFAPNRVQFSQNPMETDYIYMRVEEFYLLSAEASAKIGDESGAKLRLKQLLESRLGGALQANAYVDPLSGNALKDAIYLQTRLELWGEGKVYFAMKRNQKTITRGTNHIFQPGISLPYNDGKLSFLIPQSEMNNNPNITQQN